MVEAIMPTIFLNSKNLIFGRLLKPPNPKNYSA
jgi:hypothetical protein